ncbi:Asp-tRNA(Asn)/Glu-tRNA(Gln) amidotransferase A subunit family amidase [Bradyrhizobium sp. LM3.4]
MTTKPEMTASDIASAVAGRKMSALDATEAALARIKQHDTILNSFTDITADRARAKARAIDADIAAGKSVGPLAGVPFAVKNLFDVAGLATRAGSKINRDRVPAHARCHADRAHGSGWRRAGRCAQHGRIRL